MDLEVARKALSKRNAFSPKHVAFFVVAGLCLIVGILLRLRSILWPAGSGAECAGFGCSAPTVRRRRDACRGERHQSVPRPTTRAGTRNRTEGTGGTDRRGNEQADEAGGRTEQPRAPGSGMILVSRQPIGLLASPSSSASAMYGFPAGRPFRVIGRDGGFAHIQDLKSGASGWIDEAALAPPPSVPAVSAPSQPNVAVSRKPAKPSADPKPKATKKDSQVTAELRSGHSTGSQASWLIWPRGCLRAHLRQRQLASETGREPRVRLLRIPPRSAKTHNVRFGH